MLALLPGVQAGGRAAANPNPNPNPKTNPDPNPKQVAERLLLPGHDEQPVLKKSAPPEGAGPASPKPRRAEPSAAEFYTSELQRLQARLEQHLDLHPCPHPEPGPTPWPYALPPPSRAHALALRPGPTPWP